MNRFTRFGLAGIFTLVTCVTVQAQGQKGATPPAQKGAGQQSAYHGGYGQTPWFANQQIRQQFNLNDQQFNQLNKGYGESYNRYQDGMKGLGQNLTPAQRSQKMNDLQQNFYKDFSGSANTVLNAEQQQRYNQLHMQYQGYNAFSNPTVQEKLKLTPEQAHTFNQERQQWHDQMNALGQGYTTDNAAANSKYNELRKQSMGRMNTVLTPEQRTAWQQMTGQAYNFPASAYFQTNPTPNPK